MAELAQAAQAAVVPAEFENRTRHKIALRLLPFLFLLYIVNYVDRTNLGFAAIGMDPHVKLQAAVSCS
jgi:ACS family tartrate transporter-like MFS transporter